ncbi:uncharacterized protein FOMMEDRAFT_144674 [Fomitiporia mediterranea MF3/22]|uniref:uncharacterized protein n=1 Tax=Fomitiporia mediterranea (strain MF3/22) TaxID=694068 RepID=UPI00044072B4|nr:uncharacterized protein FOMMEDRAFT_144674 [Fomitiporia mediterranea MF3/22]EJD06762.1 hypothetical protein FOMMEDRAFT_144674 [Fomitiporia mediterranea MF3/22]
MSSKRGRKRNDNLPPNRARDVQRAFRARRAAHLQALEDRVAELEEENDNLRAALNLPPASRPPLGRGPTGKDKAKQYNRASTTRAESVMGEGSASPRTNHSSPHSMNQPIPSGSHMANPGNNSTGMWNNAISMTQHDEYGSERDVHSSMTVNPTGASTSYPPDHPFRFDAGPSTRPRTQFSTAVFPSPGPSGYHHSADRPSNSPSGFPREEPFYPMTSVSSSNRNLAQSSPGMHAHSVPHHMESAMGGTAQNSMGSHASTFPPASPASPTGGLSMSMVTRRSIHDPQHVPQRAIISSHGLTHYFLDGEMDARGDVPRAWRRAACLVHLLIPESAVPAKRRSW